MSESRSQHPAAQDGAELLKHCREVRARRSGPGGQHRNKVETAVILTHLGTDVSAEANERRSQADNRAVALFRLRINLALRIRLPANAERESTPLWKQRTCNGKLSVNPSHADFPALLAEALDRLHSSGWDAGTAAEQSGVSTSQLVRFLKLEPRAFALLNQTRAAAGLRPLR